MKLKKLGKPQIHLTIFDENFIVINYTFMLLVSKALTLITTNIVAFFPLNRIRLALKRPRPLIDADYNYWSKYMYTNMSSLARMHAFSL